MEVVTNSVVIILFIVLSVSFIHTIVIKIKKEIEKHNFDRPEMWKKAAQKLNFKCISENTLLVNQLAHYKLINVGSSRSFKSSVKGSIDGVEIDFGDLISKITRLGQGPNAIFYETHTVCILTFEHARFSHCMLRNKHKVYDYINKLSKNQDINFENDVTFSHAFILEGTIVSRTKDLFTDEVRQLFLDNISPDLQFEASGKRIILSLGDAIVPDDLEKFIRFVFALANAINKQN